MGRYISSNEVIWRIFMFPIHERKPAVIQQTVHLEIGQRVYFTEQTALQQFQKELLLNFSTFVISKMLVNSQRH